MWENFFLTIAFFVVLHCSFLLYSERGQCRFLLLLFLLWACRCSYHFHRQNGRTTWQRSYIKYLYHIHFVLLCLTVLIVVKIKIIQGITTGWSLLSYQKVTTACNMRLHTKPTHIQRNNSTESKISSFCISDSIGE